MVIALKEESKKIFAVNLCLLTTQLFFSVVVLIVFPNSRLLSYGQRRMFYYGHTHFFPDGDGLSDKTNFDLDVVFPLPFH